MSSPAQILANRRNARSSTGPSTPEGKAASSKNAVKHGLSSAFTVLAHEDQEEFYELLEDVVHEHQPVTQHQAFLVDQLTKSWWLLCRAQRLETKAFDHLAGAEPDPADPDARIITEMGKTNPGILTTLQRYVAQAERSYYRAWRELQSARKLQNEANFRELMNGTRAVPPKSALAYHPAPAPQTRSAAAQPAGQLE